MAYLLSRSVVKLVLPLSLGHWRHSLDTDGPTDRNCRRLPAWALGLSQSPYLATAMQNRLAYRLAEEAFSLVHSSVMNVVNCDWLLPFGVLQAAHDD